MSAFKFATVFVIILYFAKGGYAQHGVSSNVDDLQYFLNP